MKRIKMFPLVLGVVSIVGFYGIALGGSDPTICFPLPSPDSGPYITGTFTVALNQYDYSRYDVHFELAHRFKVHLFSWSYPLSLEGGEPSLCDLTPDMIKDPNGLMAQVPCRLDVGGPFGLIGTPVIKNVVILKRDFCQTPGDPLQMIMGAITIRVVPLR